MGPVGKVKIRTDIRYLKCDARHLQCLTREICKIAGGERIEECRTCKGGKKFVRGFERRVGNDYCDTYQKYLEEENPQLLNDANHKGKYLDFICCQVEPIDNT